MQIEKANAALDQIIDADAKVEKLADGFMFTEGPVWVRREGCLLFSDIPNGRIHRWSQSAGLSVYREPSFKSNGLTLDRQGRLVACEHVGRRVSRTGADGSVEALATNHEGKRLNSPNDVVVKSDGSIYFTDPPYGLMNDRIGAFAPRELDMAGVWRISPDGTQLTLVAEELQAPNGLAFTPDESRLYVDDSSQGTIHVYDVRADGSLGTGSVFAKLEGDGPGVPDGMKVDQQGNVYCTGPGGVFVVDPNGTLLGRLKIPGHTANLAWGDDDWRTLYLANGDAIARLRMKIPGIPVGQA